jgi:hypothetical protein
VGTVLVLVIGVIPMSLWPLVTVGNLGAIFMLRCCLGLGAFSTIKLCFKPFLL